MKKLLSVLLAVALVASLLTSAMADVGLEKFDLGTLNGDGSIDPDGFITAYNNLIYVFLTEKLDDKNTAKTVAGLLKFASREESGDGYCTYPCTVERAARLYYVDGNAGNVNRFEYIGKFAETFPSGSNENIDATLISYFMAVAMAVKGDASIVDLDKLDAWLKDSGRDPVFDSAEYTVTYSYADGQVHFLLAWKESAAEAKADAQDSAAADGPFDLRNGIHFGDTFDQIKQKETLNLMPGVNSSYYIDFYGSIAGFKNAKIRYFEDDNTGGLVRVLYIFDPDESAMKNEQFMGEVPEYQSEAKMNELYDTIRDTLTRKYGEPLGNTGGETYPFKGMVASIMLGSAIKDDWVKDYRYDEWVVEGGEQNTKIEMLYRYSYGNETNYKNSFNLRISYDPFTDADVPAEEASAESADAQSRTIDDEF